MAFDASGLLGTLFVQITSDNAQLVKGMNEARDHVKHTGESIKGAFETAKHVVEGFIAALAIEKIAEFSHQMLESIDHLKKFSTEVGVAIDQVGALKFAAEKANAGDVFEQGMRKFSEAMREAQVEGSSMQLLFRSMGLNPFGKLDEEVLKVADDFKHWNDGVNKLGVAQDLLGTRNSRLINLFNEGSEGIREQIELYRQLIGADGLEGAAKQAEEFNDSLTDLKTLGMGLFIDLSKDIIPTFTLWIRVIRDNYKVIHDLAELLNAVFVPVLKLAAINIEILVIGMVKASQWAINYANVLSPVAVLLAKIAGTSIKELMPESGGLVDSLSKDMDRIKGTLDRLSTDIDESLKKTMGAHVDTLRAGSEAMHREVQRTEAVNKKEMDDLAQQLKKMTEEFGMTAAGIQKDTFSALGFDDAAKLMGYRQEVQAAQKQIDDLAKLNKIKTSMTEDQLKKQTELMRLYGEKQKAYQQAQTLVILGTFTKMSEDILTIGEAFGGKQSALYKTLFAASKAFAIAESTVKIMQGIAGAAAQPWPLNLAAIASVVAATANIVTSIQAVKLEFGGGKATGGPVDPSRMFLVGERGPEMFVPNTAGTIVPNDQLMGGRVNVVVNNHTDATPEVIERREGSEHVIEVLLRRVKKDVAGDIKDGKGDISRALGSTFGLRRGQTQ